MSRPSPARRAHLGPNARNSGPRGTCRSWSAAKNSKTQRPARQLKQCQDRRRSLRAGSPCAVVERAQDEAADRLTAGQQLDELGRRDRPQRVEVASSWTFRARRFVGFGFSTPPTAPSGTVPALVVPQDPRSPRDRLWRARSEALLGGDGPTGGFEPLRQPGPRLALHFDRQPQEHGEAFGRGEVGCEPSVVSNVNVRAGACSISTPGRVSRFSSSVRSATVRDALIACHRALHDQQARPRARDRRSRGRRATSRPGDE